MRVVGKWESHYVAGEPTLRTAAREVAHVIQQQAGVQLSGGVGQVGDRYEQHADAVAEQVVQGRSAEALLDQHVRDATRGDEEDLARAATKSRIPRTASD